MHCQDSLCGGVGGREGSQKVVNSCVKGPDDLQAEALGHLQTEAPGWTVGDIRGMKKKRK